MSLQNKGYVEEKSQHMYGSLFVTIMTYLWLHHFIKKTDSEAHSSEGSQARHYISSALVDDTTVLRVCAKPVSTHSRRPAFSARTHTQDLRTSHEASPVS